MRTVLSATTIVCIVGIDAGVMPIRIDSQDDGKRV